MSVVKERNRAIMSSGLPWSLPTSTTGTSSGFRRAGISSRLLRPSAGHRGSTMVSPRPLSTAPSRDGNTESREKPSHGAGHKLCADGFFEALNPFLKGVSHQLPRCEAANQRCGGGKKADVLEECFWEALRVIRAELENSRPVMEPFVRRG